MKTFKDLEDNLIIICPTFNKDILVKELMDTDPLKHVKFMTKEEILEGTYFKYDLDAINYISTNYNYNLELSKEILDNLKGVIKINKKLNKLTDIYNDLKDKGLLKFNDYFKYLFTNKTIYINGYSKLDRELTTALDKLGLKYNYLEEDTHNYKPTIYKFKEMKDELVYVFGKICELILKGVSLNNIYLYKTPDEYKLLLKKFFIYHDIPFEDGDKITLYKTTIYNNYLKLLETLDFKEAYDELKATTPYDNFDALGKIVDTVLKVNAIDTTKERKLELLDYLAKNTSLKGEQFKESIKLCNNNSIITDKDYVFMLGFSLGAYPVINKDTDFYLDIEKEKLNLNTSTIKNKMAEEDLIKFINNTKNLFVSCKEKLGNKVFYDSLLVSKLGLEIKQGVVDNKRYSSNLSKLEVAGYKDLDKAYGYKNKWLNTYNNEDINYGIFDRKFKGLTSLDKDETLTLSQTRIETYNKCPFHYFINYFLKADIFEENFNTNLGKLFHEILCDYAKNGTVEMVDYQDYINKHFKTYREKYLLKKSLPQVFDVCKLNEEFIKTSYFDKGEYETNFETEIDSKTNLEGRIDKVVIDEEDKNYIVVDYKTGGFEFDKKKTLVGLNLQLPLYTYLLKQTYPDYDNVGMFIQNVCLKNKDLNAKDKYLLEGILINDENIFKRIDPKLGTEVDSEGKVINASKFVRAIKLTKDGAYDKRPKTYPKDFIDELVDIAKEQIDIANTNIRSGNFEIKPKKLSNEQYSSCYYCKNKDICFMKEEDMEYIDLSKLSFDEERE